MTTSIHTPTKPAKCFTDEVDFIMRAETGQISSEDEAAAGVQMLIDSGTIWHLQGSWQSFAQTLADAGLVHLTPTSQLN